MMPLVQQLYETSPDIRKATLKALADLGDDRALPLAVGILDPRSDDLYPLARSLLAVSAERYTEDASLLVLAIQEILGIVSPDAEAHSLKELRCDLLLTRLGIDFSDFDSRLPLRIRRIVNY